MDDPLADVLLAARELVDEADQLLTGLRKRAPQVQRPQESGTTGDQVAGEG